MQGTIEERIAKTVRDANGKIRKNQKVYDVRYRFTDPKTGKRHTTRKRGFLRRADAETFLLKINQDEADGIITSHKSLLVKDFMNDWLNTYVRDNLRESTYEGYEYDINNHIIPQLGQYDIKNLTAAHIDKFYSHLRQEGRVDGKGGLKEISIKRIHRVLNLALNHAEKHDLIARNPMHKVISPPKPEKSERDIYDDREVLRLIEIVKDSHRFEVAVALGGICGLRSGEILGLKEADIDFDKRLIHIRKQLVQLKKGSNRTKVKTDGSNRVISAPDLIFEILRRQIERNKRNKAMLLDGYNDEGFLVCYDDGKPIPPKRFSAYFCNLIKRHKLKHIRFHDLRHSGATLMLKAGVSLEVVSSILGHSSIKTTNDIYAHILNDVKIDAAKKVEVLLNFTKNFENP